MNKRINYLNNKDILAEIAKSKNTFCSYTDPDYGQYDLILPSIDKINIRTVAEAKRNKAKRLQQKAFENAKAQGKRVKLAEFEVDYRKIAKEDVIFRIMTYDHIPDEPGRKKNPKTVADTKTKLNFPPFQHYKYNEAILQLSQIGLQFDESKSNNPFAYYTAAVTNSFVRVINIEKRNQNIRDDILEMNHMNPSYTRQSQGEWERQLKDHAVSSQKTEK